MGVARPFAHALADIELTRENAPNASIYLVANKMDLVPDYDFSWIEDLAAREHVSLAKAVARTNQGIEPLYLDVAQRLAAKRI